MFIGTFIGLLIFVPTIPMWIKPLCFIAFLLPVAYQSYYAFKQDCKLYGWLMIACGIALMLFAGGYLYLMNAAPQ